MEERPSKRYSCRLLYSRKGQNKARKPSKTPIAFVIITLCLFSISQAGEAKEFADGKIELFFGPPEYGAKDSLEAELVDFINQAKESQDISVQELDSEIIAQAILNASQRKKASNPKRKLSIRIILEESYQLGESYDENRQIYMNLLLNKHYSAPTS